MNVHDDLRISHRVFEAVDFSRNPGCRIFEGSLKLRAGGLATEEKETSQSVE
jgi:hypothetical protein